MKNLGGKMRNKLLFGVVASLLLSPAIAQVGRPPLLEVERIISGNALIGFSWVDQPLARVILIRSKTAICGVRFTSVRRDTTPNASTVLTSGGLYEYAEADIAAINIRDSSDFKTVTPKKVSLSFKGLIGVGHLSGERGDIFVKCGNKKVWWEYPTSLSFETRGETVEIAPTAWLNFEDIDLLDKKLVWYKKDRYNNRHLMTLPIADLPGGQ